LVRWRTKARSSELAVASRGLGDMPECILIVDDDPNIRKHTRDFFERQTQYSVCGEAVDGLDAIEKARQLHPDLIILDMSMPRMNGLQAARILRQMMKDVPIILFTLHASAIVLSEVQAMGVSSVVSKSHGFDGLRKQVESLLESV
jgi:DNA-binding NarL/FixJ family response regulator